MIKQAPSVGRIAAMAIFTLSCFGILLFLWLSFGGSTPLAPKGYRFQVAVPEAATLAPEAVVRTSGVDVGHVKGKRLDKTGARTLVEVELDSQYAPIHRHARVTLRTKTLLGESYLELAPGDRSAPPLPDGGRLPDARVKPSVEIDEIAGAFDRPTKRALGDYARELTTGLGGGRTQDLNDALGNLATFTDDSDGLLRVLDREGLSLRRLIRNGGTVFGALNERRGALRGLIADSRGTFHALASQDRSLAETIRILPTFLDESRVTTARVARSLTAADPVISDLRPAADDLRPTLRDLAALSPDLERTFRALPPLIRASRSGLPALERTLRAVGPVVDTVPTFAREFNPVVSMLGFYQQRLADFIANGAAGLQYHIGGEHVAPNTAVVDPRSFEYYDSRPEFDRGNAYLQPNELNRLFALGFYEAFDCSKAGPPTNRYGDVKGNDAVNEPALTKMTAKRPPCLVAGPSLYDGKLYSRPGPGQAPVKKPPNGVEGSLPIPGRP